MTLMIVKPKIMFLFRLLTEYSSEEQKLRELSERVLRFERKDPSQWIVQVKYSKTLCLCLEPYNICMF